MLPARPRSLSRSGGSTPRLQCSPGSAIPGKAHGSFDKESPQPSVLLRPLGRIRKGPAPGRIVVEGTHEELDHIGRLLRGRDAFTEIVV